MIQSTIKVLVYFLTFREMTVCCDSFPLNIKTRNIYPSPASHLEGTPPIRNLMFYMQFPAQGGVPVPSVFLTFDLPLL